MDYPEILSQITAWKGVETEYWTAVNLLKNYSQLSDAELKRLNLGLDCYTGDLVTYKMLRFGKECREKIPAPETTVIERKKTDVKLRRKKK